MMSKKLEAIINTAIKKANELKHEFLTLETVLWSLLDDEQVTEVLKNCGSDLVQLRMDLETFLQDSKNFSILNSDQIKSLSERQFVDEDLRKLAAQSGILYQPEISLSLQRVLQRAAMHVQSSGKKSIGGVNLLIAMFQEKESYALYLLKKQGLERFDVVKYVAHSLTKHDPSSLGADGAADGPFQHPGRQQGVKTALDEFTVNLNQLAEKQKIDPIIGRTKEISRIVQILCRRRKNNPLLVGDAGVGKTALAEGLAWSIVQKKVPTVLENTTIFALDMASLLAGAKFRGDFEQRLKNVVSELEKRGEQEKDSVLFIDELHTVMGAGSTGTGSMDASNLLKPALAAGKIKIMGSTTHEEYRKFIEKDSAFSRRFQKIDIEEPTTEDTFLILKGLKSRYEEHHGVEYSDDVLKTAVELGNRYISDRKNPDKALDIIDEAGAAVQLLSPEERIKSIQRDDLEKVVSHLAKVPQVSVNSNEKEQLKKLKDNLLLAIYGQNEAVERVSDSILMARSGLAHSQRPLASFLFAGPTGVGKTELARQLALQLDSHLQRFDMSEYMEKHSVSKLIGAPPGYIGHDQGGVLTDAVKKNPHCILLLDEIEKAHPDIFNVLLQVMDHGKLTDAQGRTTDFRNTVIIMTTNAGAQEMEAGSIGLGQQTLDNTTKRDRALKNFFTPEFRNRLDGIIYFNRLDNKYIVRIVEKFLYELEEKLLAKQVELQVTDEAKEWLASVGYDPKMGARPISRLIDTLIKKPLSHEVLFGKLEDGGCVVVDLKKDKKAQNTTDEGLQFTYKT